MQELFETRNGRVIMDEDLSSKMYLIKHYHPEKADETSSGFEWSEMGMANLFGLLYSHEARYCPEHKSWYTYHEGECSFSSSHDTMIPGLPASTEGLAA